MMLRYELQREACRIIQTVNLKAEQRAELAKIETTVLCGDLLATTNRSLGQTCRQGVERVRRSLANFGVRP